MRAEDGDKSPAEKRRRVAAVQGQRLTVMDSDDWKRASDDSIKLLVEFIK